MPPKSAVCVLKCKYVTMTFWWWVLYVLFESWDQDATEAKRFNNLLNILQKNNQLIFDIFLNIIFWISALESM